MLCCPHWKAIHDKLPYSPPASVQHTCKCAHKCMITCKQHIKGWIQPALPGSWAHYSLVVLNEFLLYYFESIFSPPRDHADDGEDQCSLHLQVTKFQREVCGPWLLFDKMECDSHHSAEGRIPQWRKAVPLLLPGPLDGGFFGSHQAWDSQWGMRLV